MKCRTRTGFTLVELLVVIAIIGILVALLMPAVQGARESARRVQCKNNLKQLGVAVHSFSTARRMLPPSRICDHKGTWLVVIMPHVEQQSLFDKWDIMTCFYVQPREVREAVVPGYICPSRDHDRLTVKNRPDGGHNSHRGQGDENDNEFWGAVTDYAAATGLKGRVGPDGVNHEGAMIYGSVTTHRLVIPSWRSNTKMASIMDGKSSTFLAGEWTYRRAHAVSAYNGDHNPGTYAGPPPDTPDPDDGKWETFRVYPISRDPNGPCFGSDHPGVCNFVFCDASVHSISVETDPQVLGSLITRHGGEVISADAY